VVFWTHTVKDRATGWLDDRFHAAFREAALHAAVRENLYCPIYTLMPDHGHMIWMGLSEHSDQRLATSFLRKHLAPLLLPAEWQHQPFDRVLRADERNQDAIALTARDIAENPVRAGLAKGASEWRFTGCVVPGYPKLFPHTADFWDTFWRLYNEAATRGSVAGKLAHASPAA